MRRNGQLISPLTVDKGIKFGCRRKATIAALHIANVIKGGSLRLLGSSLSSSTFVFCLLLSFCAQKPLCRKRRSGQKQDSRLPIPTRTPVSAPTYDAEEGLIKLDVVVTDKSGKPISGIAR